MSGAFRHLAPGSRVFYGDRCLEQLGPEIRRVGASRAMVFCGRTLSTAEPGLETVQAALSDLYAGAFTDVREQSPVPSVEAAVAALRDHKADAIVVLGGGSAVVTARAAAILLAEGKPAQELCTVFEPGKPPVSPKLPQPKLPQFVAATTPTTAYAKSGAAVTLPETGQRLALFDPKARAQALFFHPPLFMAAPPRLVRDAALDAFAQGIQGLESDRREPLADALLLHGARLIWNCLLGLEEQPSSESYRGALMSAAQLVGEGTDYTGAGLASALGHCIGARFSVANGLAKAIVLPHTLLYNAPKTQDRLADVVDVLGLRKVGRDGDPAKVLAHAFADRFAALGLPGRLRDVGLAPTDLPAVAEETQRDWFATQNPRPVQTGELLDLLEEAW